MSSSFVRTIKHRKAPATTEPLYTNVQNDIISDPDEIWIRHRGHYETLTGSVVDTITTNSDLLEVHYDRKKRQLTLIPKDTDVLKYLSSSDNSLLEVERVDEHTAILHPKYGKSITNILSANEAMLKVIRDNDNQVTLQPILPDVSSDNPDLLGVTKDEKNNKIILSPKQKPLTVVNQSEDVNLDYDNKSNTLKIVDIASQNESEWLSVTGKNKTIIDHANPKNNVYMGLPIHYIWITLRDKYDREKGWWKYDDLTVYDDYDWVLDPFKNVAPPAPGEEEKNAYTLDEILNYRLEISFSTWKKDLRSYPITAYISNRNAIDNKLYFYPIVSFNRLQGNQAMSEIYVNTCIGNENFTIGDKVGEIDRIDLNIYIGKIHLTIQRPVIPNPTKNKEAKK